MPPVIIGTPTPASLLRVHSSGYRILSLALLLERMRHWNRVEEQNRQ